MTNAFKYTPRKADVALRGNMGSASFLTRSTGSGKGWTRQDAIRSAREARPETVKKYPQRIANVRRVPSIGGFHVIGMGQLPQLSIGELKTRLGAKGYTGYRFGGIVSKLFKKS